MQNTINNITYIDSEFLTVTFSYIIINVSSINEKIGTITEFSEKYNISGKTNGKLLVFAEMVQPHTSIIKFIDDVLTPNGFENNKDFVLGYEQLTAGPYGNSNVFIPIDEDLDGLLHIDWLGSNLQKKGNYIWHRDLTDWKAYLERRNEKFSQRGMGFLKHILPLYIEKYFPDELQYKPEIIERRKDLVYYSYHLKNEIKTVEYQTLKKYYNVLEAIKSENE